MFSSGVISETKAISTATTTNFTGVPIPNGACRVVNTLIDITRTNGTVSDIELQITHDGTNYATLANDATGYTASTTVRLQADFPTGTLARIAVTTTGTVVVTAISQMVFASERM